MEAVKSSLHRVSSAWPFVHTARIIPTEGEAHNVQNNDQGWHEIYYKDWGTGQPIVFSVFRWLGRTDAVPLVNMATASSRMTAERVGALLKPGTAMRWISPRARRKI